MLEEAGLTKEQLGKLFELLQADKEGPKDKADMLKGLQSLMSMLEHGGEHGAADGKD